MALPIIAIKTIAELAFTAIPLAERLIRGPGRGAEKKDAAREFIFEELQNVGRTNAEALPDFANFDWVAAIKDLPALAALVDDIIDSTVALINALSKYSRTTEGPVTNSPLYLA